MNDDLTQSLLSAEADLLAALQTSTQVLSSYGQTWSNLLGRLRTAPKMRIIGSETLSLADNVASRISIISNCFSELEHEEESFTTSLQNDWDTMCRQLAALDLNSDSISSQPDDGPAIRRSPSLSRQSPETEGSSPPFLALAYQWLLDNLHNPYPTPEVKNRIATSSSCQVSSINSWFTNTRRRIGWTALCREHFSNCRADMVDAAYRALVKEDPQRILSPAIRHAFVAMKVTAENLYSSTFARSAFTDTLLDDSIIGRSTEPGECSRSEHACPAETPCDLCHSPDQSVSASPVPGLVSSLTDESEEEEDVAPPILAGSKRRRPSIEPADQAPPANRPIKRLRPSKTCLPPPPTSSDDTDIRPDNDTPESPPVQSVPSAIDQVLPSRKRRLSDADTNGLPQPPYGAMPASRPHVASDSWPLSNTNNEYSVDDWFNTDFDALFSMPPPVEASRPDSSASWDVELFRDYSIPGNSRQDSNYSPARECLPPHMFNGNRDTAAADTYPPVPTDLSDLLRSIEGETFATSSDNLLLSDASEIPYMTSTSSSTPNILQTSIDWTPLLSGTEVPQPIIYSSFPQYLVEPQTLSDIDLSVLQLPPVIPSVNPQADPASKYAKLHQLHVMQDAVRRIEQELQSEGVIF